MEEFLEKLKSIRNSYVVIQGQYVVSIYQLDELIQEIETAQQQVKVEPEVIQKPKPKTLQAIFEIIDNVDFELARLEDIAKGEIGDKITLLRKYIDENRVSA